MGWSKALVHMDKLYFAEQCIRFDAAKAAYLNSVEPNSIIKCTDTLGLRVISLKQHSNLPNYTIILINIIDLHDTINPFGITVTWPSAQLDKLVLSKSQVVLLPACQKQAPHSVDISP